MIGILIRINYDRVSCIEMPNINISLIVIILILSFSTLMPIVAYSEPLANTEEDWQYVNGNSWGWNYSPQNQIKRNNIHSLEVMWVYPIDSISSSLIQNNLINFQEGTNTPPIVHDGKVFITSNYLRTYAIDAKDGSELWRHDYEIDPEVVQERLDIQFAYWLTSHVHSIRYWENGDVILYQGMACDIIGIDANDGTTKFHIEDLCKDIPGNLYSYRTTPTSIANVGTWEAGQQFIVVFPGLMHSSPYLGDGRHVMMGVSMNPPYEILWKVFSYPEHGVPDKDWALKECDIGFFRDVPCSDVAAENLEQLEWDWAFPDEPPSIYGGVTSNWGQPIIDEDTGILYTQTGNQGPYSNVTMTPGPRLYGSTIMAIDLNQGVRKWWLQPFPHDLYDYDCNWSGILAEIPQLIQGRDEKVYIKGCKEGIIYVMNAATGEPIVTYDVIDDQIEWGQISPEAGLGPEEGGVRYHKTDLFGDDMRTWNFITDGKYSSGYSLLYPFWIHGIFGSDMSYDPTTKTLFYYANAIYGNVTQESPYVSAKLTKANPVTPWNATIVARDLKTGEVKWRWFYPDSAQRSHLVVLDDMVFSGFTDGSLKFFKKAGTDDDIENEDEGERLIRTINVGSPIVTGPTTGQDSDGNQKIFVIKENTNLITWGGFSGDGYSNLDAPSSGTLVAYGLRDDRSRPEDDCIPPAFWGIGEEPPEDSELPDCDELELEDEEEIDEGNISTSLAIGGIAAAGAGGAAAGAYSQRRRK